MQSILKLSIAQQNVLALMRQGYQLEDLGGDWHSNFQLTTPDHSATVLVSDATVKALLSKRLLRYEQGSYRLEAS